MSDLVRMVSLTGVLVMLSICGCGNDSGQTRQVKVDSQRVQLLREAIHGGAPSDEESAAPADVQQPTGWATLRGSFKVSGEPPAPVALRVDKDTEVCAPGGQEMFSESVVVGSDNGLRNVVVFLNRDIPAEEPWMHPSAQPVQGEVIFDQKNCVFLSHVLGMQASQMLKILNSDPIGHNTLLSPRSNPGFNRTVAAGGATTYQPETEENAPFPVACSIHPWMSAWIMVHGNGYFAVTADDGSFEIPNLPAGVELEFRVWQEKAKFIEKVRVNGQEAEWGKGRFVMTLAADNPSQNDLQVVVDAAILK